MDARIDKKIPAEAQITEITADARITDRKLLKIRMAERDGKIISADIRSDPTSFMASTITEAVTTAISRLSPVLPGALAALAGALAAGMVDISLLRRPFGVFLLYAGASLLLGGRSRRQKGQGREESQEQEDPDSQRKMEKTE